MNSAEIRERYLKFFEKRGHKIIPSASLIPENDPTVLFNTAGMQPLVPYLMGKKHPAGDKLVDVQKCVRTTDIEDIGDNTHATFFEMLGNWSLGSYFKEEAIKWSYDLLTSKTEGFGLDPKRLYVTVFEGDSRVPKDTESFEVWKKVGLPENRIYFKGADSNWWPAVKGKDTWTGPTGPCTEMFYDVTPEGLGDLSKEGFIEADEKQQVVEIWNDVFMEYEKEEGDIVGKLVQKNVDTGAGLERIASILQKTKSIFETDLLAPIMIQARLVSPDEKSARIIADHFRAAVFMIADGARPSNTDRGYVLRRLLRRAVIKSKAKDLSNREISRLVNSVLEIYADIYPELSNFSEIEQVIGEEISKFKKTLEKGLKEIERITNLTGEKAFSIYETYGFPLELSEEIKPIENREDFFKKLKEHQEISKAGSEKKFKGGLGGTGEVETRYHTATHLLHQALRDVLGPAVQQKGSNITSERLRFDFTYPTKMTDEDKKRVEDIVNEKIMEKLPVNKVIMSKVEAEKTGALHFFADKYGDEVSVYFIGDSIENAYSKEFCGGPHVTNTAELGHFKIVKEEAVSAGVRRIKATLS